MKNALKSIGNSAAHVGKSTSKLKDRNIEIIWVEEERKQRFFLNKKNLQELFNSIWKENIRLMGMPEWKNEEKESKKLI